VYAFAAGYDQGGPSADEPAYDDIIQAAAGVAALNANERQESRYLSTILCDKVGGLHLAIAVASDIAHRVRTGLGCCIEAPMFESTVSFLMTEQLGGATFVPPLGSTGYDRLSSPNRKPYRTRNGFIAILPYNTTHWTAFFELIGKPEQAQSQTVQNPVRRSQHVDSLYAMVAAVAPTRPAANGSNCCARGTFPARASPTLATCWWNRISWRRAFSANSTIRRKAACATHVHPFACTVYNTKSPTGRRLARVRTGWAFSPRSASPQRMWARSFRAT
jgi:crotonobetainyl-CoA:carnitine CoA-transferase CaiB-like acyl-CoA transferase